MEHIWIIPYKSSNIFHQGYFKTVKYFFEVSIDIIYLIDFLVFKLSVFYFVSGMSNLALASSEMLKYFSDIVANTLRVTLVFVECFTPEIP